MIVYITTQLGRRAIAESFPHLPDDLRQRVKLTNYHTLQRQSSLPVATYIFADIERLRTGAAGRPVTRYPDAVTHL
ncbi:MAG: hypothetical protein WEC00_04185 [Dongiaceae bacterium]